MAASASRFIDRLTLETVDRDIFSGTCHSGAPLRAYGGQIAAQALMAAGMTVDDKARRVHSLHGYFLRPGRTKDSIIYLVDRPRDGRSFSTRIVRAVQQGETIFLMTASFAVTDIGPDHQFEIPAVAPPDEVPEMSYPEILALDPDSALSLNYPDQALIDLRIVDHEHHVLLSDGRYESMSWVRITEPLATDPLTQAGALTYLSDLTMVRTALSPHFEMHDELQLASIDHAMWFHAPIDTGQWLLFAQDTPVARGGHGLARGLFYDRQGQLVASVVQESLMRMRRRH
ncbi:MAG: acyl-CoA thioesterase II [Actinomycetota bacterium]|nr:acyl-CoA thioesterase II [Actinomycetota bacterium]